MHKVLCFIVLIFLISCSSEKPSKLSKQRALEAGKTDIPETSQSYIPVSPDNTYSLEITPKDVSRSSTLYLAAKGFDLSSAKVEWLVNGNPTTSQIPGQFKASETQKGDTVQARAIIQSREILSNTVKIKNSPPEISRVKIMPEVFKPGDNLYVEVLGSDIDGDAVTISCEWFKNGEVVGNGRQLTVPIKRGDKIDVKITPFDGEDYGGTVTLHREIRNMPPIITEDKKFNFDGKVWSYQIKASDPDGDPLTYSLKKAPAGMVIDKSTGLITWKVTEKDAGRHPVTVQVTDGHGGEALYNFDVTIGFEGK